MLGAGSWEHLCSCVGSHGISSVVSWDRALHQESEDLAGPTSQLPVCTCRNLRMSFSHLRLSVSSANSWVIRVVEWYTCGAWASPTPIHMVGIAKWSIIPLNTEIASDNFAATSSHSHSALRDRMKAAAIPRHLIKL